MLIAEAYLEQKEYAKSEDVFKQCLQYEKQFINVDQAELHFKIGTLYREQKRLTDSEKEFLKSLELANKYDYKEIVQKANYQMFLVRFEENDRVSALKYLNKANALNDSIFSIEKARSVAGLELKFNSEKRENELNSLKARENRLFLILSIAAFLMIVLFMSYIIQLRGRNYRSLKMKNEEIQNQYKRLEESNEILSQFAYVVAHDLKEPLRSIGSYIGLIQMKHGKDLPDSAKEYMQFVNAGVRRMYSLLTDLRDFSQISGLANTPAEASYNTCAWCHGAAGIALSRLRAYQVLGEESLKKEAEIAIKKTVKELRLDATESTSLCHGMAGNSDILITASQILKQPEYMLKAYNTGDYIINELIKKNKPFYNGLHNTHDLPDMMLGSAGVGYFFLRLFDSIQFESILMIDG